MNLQTSHILNYKTQGFISFQNKSVQTLEGAVSKPEKSSNKTRSENAYFNVRSSPQLTFRRAELVSVKLLSMTIGSNKSTRAVSRFLEVSILYGNALDSQPKTGGVNIDAFGVQVNINGGTGDDVINGIGSQVNVYGGSGNDVLSGYGLQTNVYGGSGNDVLRGHGSQVNLHGGTGNDVLRGYGLQSNLYGGSGDDRLNAYSDQANVDGGIGNDVINAHAAQLNAYGGSGNDVIYATGLQLNIDGGQGNDAINASGLQVNIDGGQGDDVIDASGLQANINAGKGNDTLNLISVQAANIQYLKGDGHDIIKGARQNSTVNIGPGLTFEQATFSSKNGDITIHFGESNGSITIQDYKRFGIPKIQFADGYSLGAQDFITLAGGVIKGFNMGSVYI